MGIGFQLSAYWHPRCVSGQRKWKCTNGSKRHLSINRLSGKVAAIGSRKKKCPQSPFGKNSSMCIKGAVCAYGDFNSKALRFQLFSMHLKLAQKICLTYEQCLVQPRRQGDSITSCTTQQLSLISLQWGFYITISKQ